MPLEKEEDYGTNADGSKNEEYCIYCYKDGKFIHDIGSVEEYIEMNIPYAEQAGMTTEQMREHCERVFPTLKRWKK
jgi:hypothetical protein